MKSVAKKSSEFSFNFNIVPKARPRFTGTNLAYMPKKYTLCKNRIIFEILKAQVPNFKGPVRIEIFLSKKSARANSDLDNIAGTILDALVKAGVLGGDSLKYIPSLFIEMTKNTGSLTTVKISEY